jgi:assimilatory nitrate reductase catalytic subunit
MTRTGKAPRLSSHMAEPFAEIHPDDAADRGITHASLMHLASPHGTALVRALVTTRQRRGSLFAPMHWTDRFSRTGRINALVAGDTDPHSGQPALKMAAVSASAARIALYGFAIAARRPELSRADYWAIAEAIGGWRAELAFSADPGDLPGWARAAFGLAGGTSLLTMSDSVTGWQSLAAFAGNRLEMALFVAPEPVAVSRQWAVSLLTAEIAPARRSDILAGRPGTDRPDSGPIICACNNVGSYQIAGAIRAGCDDVDAIGRALGAGTGCGSCRPELRALLDLHRPLVPG